MSISSEGTSQENLLVVSVKMILRRTAGMIVPLWLLSTCISSTQTREHEMSVLCSLAIKPATIRPQTQNKLEVSLANPLKTELTVTALVVYLSPNVSIESADLGAMTFNAPVDLEAAGPLYAKQGRRGSSYYPPLTVRIPGGQEKKFSIDLSSLLWARMIDATLPSRRLESIEASGAYQIFARVRVKGYKNQTTSNRAPVTWLGEAKRGPLYSVPFSSSIPIFESR
jgi:hypothetical protein